MNWFEQKLGTKKPIIAMCHFEALPGDPEYKKDKGLEWIIERAKADLECLQNGGVDAIMFSNEASLPYLTEVEPITTVSMARIIGELKPFIKIPFGVNVLWDPDASVDLAVATGALFVREIFTGVYASDFGLWNTNFGKTARHKERVGGENIKLLFNIVPEAAVYLSDRDIISIARSTVFNCKPDAICVSGLTAGTETSADTLRIVKEAIPDTPVLANTGVRITNVEKQLSIADGAVIGTTFKKDGYIWNGVDEKRVREFMTKVKAVRKGI